MYKSCHRTFSFSPRKVCKNVYVYYFDEIFIINHDLFDRIKLIEHKFVCSDKNVRQIKFFYKNCLNLH